VLIYATLAYVPDTGMHQNLCGDGCDSSSSLCFSELDLQAIQEDLAPMLTIEGGPSLDGLQLHTHALRRQKLRRYAKRV
jgi:hypothetical protein